METALSVVVEESIDCSVNLIPKLLKNITKIRPTTEAQIKTWETRVTELREHLREHATEVTSNKAIGRWIDNLEKLICDAENIVGNFKYEKEIRKSRKGVLFSVKRRLKCMIWKKINSKLIQLTRKWEQIEKQREELNLSTRIGSTADSWFEGSSLSESEKVLYGRDNEERNMIELLSKSDKVVQVISIVGMSGIGKTTLARHLYNHNFREEFEVKAWICMEKTCDPMIVYKEIIEQNTDHPGLLARNCHGGVQKTVQDLLKDKKVLIVMDSLREIDERKWMSLKAPLLEGKDGSKIIVTTQHYNVAEMVSNGGNIVTLKDLSDEDSWQLFCSCAGLDHNSGLEVIRREIIEKFHGLPLALNIAGNLFRSKKNMEDWMQTLKEPSGLMKFVSSGVRRSFDDLSYDLKNIYLFCAMQNDDWDWNNYGIISLLVGAGLVVCDNESMSLQEAGRKHLLDLVSRCMLLFHEDSKCYKMHCIARAVGRHIINSEIFGNKFFYCCGDMPCMEKIMHLFLERSKFVELVDSVRVNKDKVLPLRTLIMQSNPFEDNLWDEIKREVSTNCGRSDFVDGMNVMCRKAANLRLLSLHHLPLLNLPISIFEMKLLTYLDVSNWTLLRELPQEIGELINLCFLKLRGCASLIRLPKEIGMLTKLRDLDLEGCKRLKQLPGEIGKLINLFQLVLKGCEGISGLPVEIGMMKKLCRLTLEGCKSLKKLPAEIGMLDKLSELCLIACEELIELPVEIRMLANLSLLNLEGCRGLTYVHPEILKLDRNPEVQKSRSLSLHPEIQKLYRSLKGLPRFTAFERLTDLSKVFSKDRQGLTELLVEIETLTSLSLLHLETCKRLTRLPVEVRNLTTISYLCLYGCKRLTTLPAEIGMLKNLSELRLHDCEGLIQLPVEIGRLTNLSELFLYGCEGLTTLPAEIGMLKNLSALCLRDCKSLIQLPVEIGKLTNLSVLDLDGCKGLTTLPAEIGNLVNLSALFLNECEGLTELPIEISNLTNLSLEI